jgi:hypothetical protein
VGCRTGGRAVHSPFKRRDKGFFTVSLLT